MASFVGGLPEMRSDFVQGVEPQEGMSQGDICRKLNMDRSYMSAIESGKKNITLGILEKLADALARKCDIPYTTLTKIESNVITKPSIQTVSKIAEGLGISIDDLIK